MRSGYRIAFQDVRFCDCIYSFKESADGNPWITSTIEAGNAFDAVCRFAEKAFHVFKFSHTEPRCHVTCFGCFAAGWIAGRVGLMKEITSHKVNGLNEELLIRAVDEPGPGGAHHVYSITSIRREPGIKGMLKQVECSIEFQNGPIKEAGVNGISGEALLAIVEDRLKDFQAGQYACRENACALTKIQEAMMWLHRRTNERLQRGVEGTMQK